MYHAAIPFRSLTDPADPRQYAGHAGIGSRGGLSERMPLTPEQRAREKIDRQLAAAGWVVQDHRDMDIHASVGVAVREYPLKWKEAGEAKSGSADYLLYADGRSIGVVEAKPAGHTLQGHPPVPEVHRRTASVGPGMATPPSVRLRIDRRGDAVH